MKTLPASLAFLAVIVVTLFVFSPALPGPFVLDDKVHMPKLAGSDGQVDTLQEVHALVFSGNRFPGRQISYLSLLIEDNAWPTSAHAYKRTNLLLHLVNGVLVLVLIRQLMRLSYKGTASRTPPPKAELAAVLGMAIWIVHPIHISTTMMVIQRMTLLAGLFSLLAVNAYVYGRSMPRERWLTAYFWMAAAFPAALALGILSKEAAIVSVLYVLVLELTVLSRFQPARPRFWRVYAATFLFAPIGGVVGYYVLNAESMTQFYSIRNFDMGERILSEARVLTLYLKTILLPTISSTGPYHDGLAPSRSLIEPLTTLPAVVLVTALVFAGFALRRRAVLLSFSILWFFAGHTLESTALPLELYFEHRNYLPMLGFSVALALWIAAPQHDEGTAVRLGLVKAGGLALAAAFAVITSQAAAVWGDSARMALVWSQEHPASSRAQLDAASLYSALSDTQNLRGTLDRAIESRPTEVGFELTRWIFERCRPPSDPSLGADFAALKAKIPKATFEYGSLGALQWLLNNRAKQDCRVTDEEIIDVLDTLLRNEIFASFKLARARLFQLKARVYSEQGYLNGVIESMDEIYMALPDYRTRLQQAEYLLSAGLIDDAERFVAVAQESKRRFLGQHLLKSQEIARVQALIDEARRAGLPHNTSAPPND